MKQDWQFLVSPAPCFATETSGVKVLFGIALATGKIAVGVVEQEPFRMSHRTERRRRKKLRERQDARSPLSPPLKCRDGRNGDVALFQDPGATAADLRLVRRAVNHDWDTQPEMQEWLVEEVMKVVRQTDGVSEYQSDKNSMLAIAAVYDMYRACYRDQGETIPGLPAC